MSRLVIYSWLSNRAFTKVVQKKTRRRLVMPGASLLTLVIVLSIPSSALADPVQIVASYSGQINGVAVNATATGQMDTSGTSLNHFEISFASIPSSISPFIAGNCWNSSYHASGALALGGAANLFTLSGGNYIAGRTVRWGTLPGDEIVFVATVSTSGGIMTSNQSVNGTYSGPTDVIGVTDYQMVWAQVDATTIEVISTATLLRSNGESFDAQITSVYSGLSAQMPFSVQVGSYTFSNQSFSNNVMSFDWQGVVEPVPEPGALTLLGLGICGLVGGTFRSRLWKRL